MNTFLTIREKNMLSIHTHTHTHLQVQLIFQKTLTGDYISPQYTATNVSKT